jgi:predicted acyl esterase
MKLHIQALNCPDVDLFLALQKIDSSGKEVLFYHSTQQIEAPASLGWLRASHRELDPERSIPGRPYHTHARRQWLRPRDIVPVEVELWPTSTVWEKGDTLRITVKGTPFTNSENPTQGRIPSHSFGEVKVWFGGKYDSGLLVPIMSNV